MNTISAYFQKISYDIYCPSATIAEHMCTNLLHWDKLLEEKCHQYKPEVTGKCISFKSPYKSLVSLENICESKYDNALKELGELFRIELDSNDYPVSQIRVHIQYRYEGMGKYIYNSIVNENLKEKFKTICTENLSDITMEDENTIGVTCKTFKEVDKLWTIFLEYENRFQERLQLEERLNKRIAEYNNNNRLEASTSSLITSICAMAIFFSLLSQCAG